MKKLALLGTGAFLLLCPMTGCAILSAIAGVLQLLPPGTLPF